jgi:alanine racemase
MSALPPESSTETLATDARLTIDLDALAMNYAAIRREGEGVELAPVVKADGYGLGVGPVARRLWVEGARRFFVARASEGAALREQLAGRDALIYVLDGAVAGQEPTLRDADLIPVLATAEQARRWQGMAALHIDTGMNRIGVSPDEARALAARPFEMVMSHLGSAEQQDNDRTDRQLALWRELRPLFGDVPASLSASAGSFKGEAYRYDFIRPGISLYGGGPFETPDARIRAVATLDAPILQIRDIQAGDRIGYGSMFTARKPMRVAVAGAGYADGVLRTAHARGAAALDGVKCPFLAITMDMIVVDIAACPEAKVGDRLELLGPHANLDHLAAAAGSVAHEILTGLSRRADRRYIGSVA